MGRTFGRPAEDIKSMSVAKALVAALERIEMTECCPEDIFDDAVAVAAMSLFKMARSKLSAGQVKELCLAIAALKMVYCGGPVPDALRQLRAYHAASQEEATL